MNLTINKIYKNSFFVKKDAFKDESYTFLKRETNANLKKRKEETTETAIFIVPHSATLHK